MPLDDVPFGEANAMIARRAGLGNQQQGKSVDS